MGYGLAQELRTNADDSRSILLTCIISKGLEARLQDCNQQRTLASCIDFELILLESFANRQTPTRASCFGQKGQKVSGQRKGLRNGNSLLDSHILPEWVLSFTCCGSMHLMAATPHNPLRCWKFHDIMESWFCVFCLPSKTLNPEKAIPGRPGSFTQSIKRFVKAILHGILPHGQDGAVLQNSVFFLRLLVLSSINIKHRATSLVSVPHVVFRASSVATIADATQREKQVWRGNVYGLSFHSEHCSSSPLAAQLLWRNVGLLPKQWPCRDAPTGLSKYPWSWLGVGSLHRANPSRTRIIPLLLQVHVLLAYTWLLLTSSRWDQLFVQPSRSLLKESFDVRVHRYRWWCPESPSHQSHSSPALLPSPRSCKAPDSAELRYESKLLQYRGFSSWCYQKSFNLTGSSSRPKRLLSPLSFVVGEKKTAKLR